MLELIKPIAALFITLCGFSLIVSMLLGRKMDPFMIIRPFARWAIRLPARLCRSLAKTVNKYSGLAWQKASRSRSLTVKIIFFLASAGLGATGMALTIPAEIFGEAQRLPRT